MIKLQSINKSFKEQVIFEDVSIVLEKKKIKIKGENESGKSVLLRIIVGYSVPESGEVYYDGKKQLRIDSDFLEDAGVSINAPQFMKGWSGRENLQYLADIRKKCTPEKLNELIKLFSLDDAIDKKYKTYSLGMRQKLRIIQALMDEPRYLILDEPFDALDKKTKAFTKEYLDQYLAADPSRMLIYTSHSEADDVYADQIVYIDDYNVEIQDNHNEAS